MLHAHPPDNPNDETGGLPPALATPKGERSMIALVWHGWTTHRNADAYEAVLRTETIPRALAKNVAGPREIQVLRLDRLGETEFMAIMWFDGLAAVQAFAAARGLPESKYERSVVSLGARNLLRRSDAKVKPYEVCEISKA